MELGIVGLGRMGANMARRLMKDGHRIVAYDVNPDGRLRAGRRGRRGRRLARGLRREAERAARGLGDGPRGQDHRRRRSRAGTRCSSRGDAIIDGGNSYYRDDMRRASALAEKGIDYIDCGTSGGVFGLERGYCLMIGGPDGAVERLDPIFASPGAGGRLGGAHAGSDRRPEPGRERLPALRPERRRALREDGPQRDRVRDHGRLRGGAERPRQRRRGQDEAAETTPRRRRSTSPSTTNSTSTSRVAEVWRRGSRGRLLAARPDRGGAAPRIPRALRLQPAASPTRARAAGPRSRRSMRACRRRSSPPPCMSASPRATSTTSATKSSRRCASSSAATTRRPSERAAGRAEARGHRAGGPRRRTRRRRGAAPS